MYSIPYLDLSISDEEERNELLKAIERVLKHGRLILGPEVLEIEKKLAEYCGRKYAVGVASGTDALFLALRALNIGIGDEIITNAYSWIATANTIYMAGATPVFADVLSDLTIDPYAVEELINEKTKGIIAVNYSGRICDFDRINSIAEKYGIYVIEDASQSFGAYRKGQIAGSFGTISCISLNPMKVFGACGESGVVLTNDNEVKQILECDRYNGMKNKTTFIKPGLNSRIDTIQAAILLHRLKNVESIISKRREIANFYNNQLKKLEINVFEDYDGIESSYFSYFIQIDYRDELLSFLNSRQIECKVRDSDYLPIQPVYNTCKENASHIKSIYKNFLLLPLSEILDAVHVERIVNEIKLFIESK